MQSGRREFFLYETHRQVQQSLPDKAMLLSYARADTDTAPGRRSASLRTENQFFREWFAVRHLHLLLRRNQRCRSFPVRFG